MAGLGNNLSEVQIAIAVGWDRRMAGLGNWSLSSLARVDV